ncbi:MAG: sigma-54-dependent Fis family transcriptional regulator [Kofleriaceae bacterium]|nr:sigma-54-dependent Fis family transcriptional regulator [Kofleriaceae bacterium]
MSKPGYRIALPSGIASICPARNLFVPDWSQLFELKKVELATNVLERRWKLSLGKIDIETRKITGYQCPLGCLEDDCEACDDFKTELFSLLSGSSSADLTQTSSRQHHDVFASIIAPILVNSTCIGALCLHGLQTQALFSADSPDILSERELVFVRELLEEGRSEIVSTLTAEIDLLAPEEAAASIAARYPTLIGTAPSMISLYELLDKVCQSQSTVLINGENGTGRELVAKAIYDNGKHRGAFVAHNCSAFNDNLLESELFGHKRGAFTGAHSDKTGLFEAADGGTFFLDEIGEMSPALQVKLLRVLQEGTFTPLGGTVEKKVNVRIISATNRDLELMVEQGGFRKDLYYRINVINVQLPALRDRIEDIDSLTTYFLAKHGGSGKILSRECLAQFRGYSWPGNVRELENEIERLVVLASDEPVIGHEMLSSRIRTVKPDSLGAAEDQGSLPHAVKRLERRMIRHALREHEGNKTRAAQTLKISRRNLIRLAQKYDLS